MSHGPEAGPCVQRAASKARDKAQADAEADKAPPAPKVEAGAGAAPAPPQAAEDSKAVEADKAGTQAAEPQGADQPSELTKPKAEAGKEEPAGAEEQPKGDKKEGAVVRLSSLFFFSCRALMVLHDLHKQKRVTCQCLHNGALQGHVEPSGPCTASASLWTRHMSCLVHTVVQAAAFRTMLNYCAWYRSQWRLMLRRSSHLTR